MLRITEGAATIFQEYYRNIATQIINLQTILDPEKFVIGEAYLRILYSLLPLKKS